MPQLYDVTTWNQQSWFSTGGTRSKKFIQSPGGKFYYFKKSYKTAGRDYFFEFWSEIVASGIGNLLGFDMLKYDIAIDGEDMGCLSENMLANGEELIEGGKYLQAVENDFNPDVRTTRNMYSFQLIEAALKGFKLDNYLDRIIEIIVFDALIGNSDRHQENWAFVNIITFIPRTISEIDNAAKMGYFEKYPAWFRNSWIFKRMIDLEGKQVKQDAKLVKLYLQKTKGFTPIYDSGSSLGRELTEEKVENMLTDTQQFEAYLARGTSEIHWGDEKLNHFDLIVELLHSKYADIVMQVIKRVIEKFDGDAVEKLVNEVDDLVPADYARFKLTMARKRLMIKLITSRFQILKSL